jgi:hypothetical protein
MMLEPWELQIHVKDDLLCHGPRHFGTGKHFGRLGNAATVTADWTFFAHLTPDLPAIAMKRSLLDSPIPDLQDLFRAFGIVRVSDLRPYTFRCLGHLAKLGPSLETASHAIIALRIKHV